MCSGENDASERALSHGMSLIYVAAKRMIEDELQERAAQEHGTYLGN